MLNSPRKIWRAGVNCEGSEARGRLQIFKLGRSGMFSMVHEVGGLTQAAASRVDRGVESVALWRTKGGVEVLSSSCPVVLRSFKDWRSGL